MTVPKNKVFTKIPTDRSWEVFRDWITGFYAALTGEESDESSISDEEWQRRAEAFWRDADERADSTHDSDRSE